ncbi:MAG: cysteine--tRNA ligase [Selenomonadales bacterium]|nr:cysteine--tRNA ligase [Clostridiales bacterium]PWM00764.1 MAG: cysteine--tRNA ligase [Selenomonadales bacterium]
MKLYNTLSRSKEEFIPIKPGKAGMYSCGPTVYNYAHIGNMRTYVFMDVLRRTLEAYGYKVKSVMNITDVGHLTSDADEGEDKMARAAQEQKKTPWEIAQYYTDVFFKDLQALNIKRPNLTPKATEHIKEMLDFVQALAARGYGYETDDGIYFDISKFPDYGKLSGNDLEAQLAGARVEVNQQKRHPADFALWKKAPKEHIMQWESPWGMGYPGWHIECSAMSRKYLGDTFDLHTGGVDHIPVHHENEIAQSEALLGHPAVHYWMHGEFMMVDGGKMSKSLGNTYTISDLISRGYAPLAFRYLCLNAHYRSKLNFTWEAMSGAQVSYIRLLEGAYRHKNAPRSPQAALLAQDAWEQFLEAAGDDLNIPKALGVAWTLIRSNIKSADIYDALLKMDGILGLNLAQYEPEQQQDEPLPAEIAQLAEERQKARANKDWALSDNLREELRAKGYEAVDSKEGQRIKKL